MMRSLSKMVVKYVHGPSKENIPLYARVDNVIPSGFVNNITDKSKAIWSQYVKGVCNSPHNIRRLFISSTGVYVEMYRAVSGKATYAYKLGVNLANEAISIAQGQAKDEYIGCVLSSLLKPWICSNIEEVYIDVSTMISNEVRVIQGGRYKGYLENCIVGQESLNSPNMQAVLNYLFNSYALDKGMKTVESTYPRLKVIGCVRNLDEIYIKSRSINRNKGEYGLYGGWLKDNPIMEEAIKNGDAGIYQIKDINEKISKYIVWENMYIFDRDILKSSFEKWGSSIDKSGVSSTPNPSTPKDKILGDEKDISKEELEIRLDKIADTMGEMMVKRSIGIYCFKMKASEISKVKESLTEEGKKRYGKYFDILGGGNSDK